MRSIPLAMTWEALQRGRWGLLLGLLGANLMPVLLLAALGHEGGFDPEDHSLTVMHVVLVQMNMFAFGAAIYSAQGTPSRLYSYPIRTESLVAWHMLLAMALVALEMSASTAVLNALFGLHWPLWGPALFSAAALVAIQATLWLTEKSAWLLFAMTLVAAGLGLWLKSRFGPMFSQPTRLWLEVTSSEVATLLAVVALSYWVAIIGVARNRCGEPLGSLGIVAWFVRVFEDPEVRLSFRSPAEAQFWFEWRKKGWLVTGIVNFCLMLGLVAWLIFNRDPKELVEGFLVGGGLLSTLGLAVGLIVGNAGPSDSNLEMGHFLGTRPMTSADMSRTILKTAALSVLIAWATWAAAFLILFGILLATQTMPQPFLPSGVQWWYFPATLLGSWTVLALVTSLGLAGRMTWIGFLFFGLFGLIIALCLFSKFALSHAAQSQLFYGLMAAGGIAFVLGTVWAYAAALRRSLVGGPVVCAAASVWIALSAVVMLEWVRHPVEQFPVYLFTIGLMAAAVAPLATAPLALTWNRNR
ncbi:MAG: hypothetical protein AABP62_05185 [Planctomycetota bacterium]